MQPQQKCQSLSQCRWRKIVLCPQPGWEGNRAHRRVAAGDAGINQEQTYKEVRPTGKDHSLLPAHAPLVLISCLITRGTTKKVWFIGPTQVRKRCRRELFESGALRPKSATNILKTVECWMSQTSKRVWRHRDLVNRATISHRNCDLLAIQ